MTRTARFQCVWAVAILLASPVLSWGCPFCSAVSMTFSEEIQKSDVVALVRLSTKDEAQGLEVLEGQQCFTVIETLKGKEHLGKQERLVQVYLGSDPPGTTFLMLAIEPGRLSWGTPIALSEEGVRYVKTLPSLLEQPASTRLKFFWQYLEHSDKVLNEDAYGEFAKAPFSDVKEIQANLDHDRLLGWIQDEKVTPSRRRLYLTLLGVVDNKGDIPLLESMLKGKDRQAKMSLDALINCYLSLRGPDGMGLVEDLFLKNANADYTDTYSAIVSLRIHGQEVKVVPRERLVEAMRTILNRPDLADLVIPDLARWEDWESTHRLVELFVKADAKSSWVRVPVINFLQSSPEPRAKALLDFLAYLDPDSYQRASAFAPFAAAPGAAPAPAPASTPSATTSPASNSSTGIAAPTDATDEAKSGDPSAAIEPRNSEPANSDPIPSKTEKALASTAPAPKQPLSATSGVERNRLEQAGPSAFESLSTNTADAGSVSPFSWVLGSLGAGLVMALMFVGLLRGGA